MDINPSEITKILKEQIKNLGDKTEVSEIGKVLSIGLDTSADSQTSNVRCLALSLRKLHSKNYSRRVVATSE